MRETIESIVVAFVLAFLFRTFEAEAFVIPTGSMSPTLQGRHKDVVCDQCGYRFRTTASSEASDVVQRWHQELNHPGTRPERREQLRRHISAQDVLGGVCPMCRYTMPFRKDLPMAVRDLVDIDSIEDQPSYQGDRILVNKYGYDVDAPVRWDVVVFKFPGNGSMNYIKRLVGLPGETLQIYQGDLFTKNGDEDGFHIERKPPDKVHAMLQPVHDTDYEPVGLYNAGWPLRWAATTPDGWQIETRPGEQTVWQQFKIDSVGDDPTAWIRYRHLVPDLVDWQEVRKLRNANAAANGERSEWADDIRPQLIADFNAYNARILRAQARQGIWQVGQSHWPANWVGDLAVECQVDVAKPQGEIVLELVEAGRQFSCRIDLATGKATLGIEAMKAFTPMADTPVNGPGSYRLLFANVDDQLLLWVDDKLVDFGDSTYDAARVFGDRADIIPRSDGTNGDLSPVGVGVRGASLTIGRLRVLRDIYYVAAKGAEGPGDPEYHRLELPAELPDGTWLPAVESWRQFFSDPQTWPRFGTRRKRRFPISDEQFFVCGDNSPESADCRLWTSSTPERGIPGGSYLDRRLLTGKALCVFWPHSWGSIPGFKQLPGFPNFGDMRIVR